MMAGQHLKPHLAKLRLHLDRGRLILLVLFILALLFLVGSVVYSNFSKDTATAQRDQTAGQLGATVDQRDQEAI